MLPLDSAAALEGLRLSVEPAEGVVNAEGSGVAELELVDAEGGGRLGGSSRSKGRGRSDEGSEKGELHRLMNCVARFWGWG